MIAGDGASGKVETSFWPYGRGFGIQTATDGQIEPDFSLSGQFPYRYFLRRPFDQAGAGRGARNPSISRRIS